MCAQRDNEFRRRCVVRHITRCLHAARAELWHIFHDELDLDGNGHLDAEELTSALYKAGV